MARLERRIRDIGGALRRAADLERDGVSARERAALVRDGALVRVRRGWFARAEDWRAWFPEDRHVAAVLAAHRDAATPPLFSHHSAAALLGLPLWRLRAEPVHVISTRCAASGSGIRRHDLRVPRRDLDGVAGVRCTGFERTLLDLARVADEAALVGIADAVLRRAVGAGRGIDPDRVEAWRRGMRERCDDAGGMRGARLLRRVIAFADPRADSVLEGVSRLHFARLGIAVDLQRRVPREDGGHYDVDFELLGLGVLGEADGEAKFTDPGMLGGRTPQEAELRERRRDHWITGSTGRRMIHWGYRDAQSTERFAAMLRAYRIPLPTGRRGAAPTDGTGLLAGPACGRDRASSRTGRRAGSRYARAGAGAAGEPGSDTRGRRTRPRNAHPASTPCARCRRGIVPHRIAPCAPRTSPYAICETPGNRTSIP
ncbi:hypothetical protein MUN77_11135 [Leucobacter allii]|uniref:hypothetical protein n=1 Tax=Leucobacter allii TaxID=2932247 RepID=UPI001FD56EEF|nr:hypothetical protein [Leucobacter allii]UOR00706.1 hypothetical protein MUN77_11135 [Leucobacter allii]